MFLCHSKSTDPRCTTGCSGNKVVSGGNRRKRDISLEKKPPSSPSQYYLVEMQVTLKDEDKVKGESTASKYLHKWLKDKSGVDKIIVKKQPEQLLITNREFIQVLMPPTVMNW